MLNSVKGETIRVPTHSVSPKGERVYVETEHAVPNLPFQSWESLEKLEKTFDLVIYLSYIISKL